jgi:hypothetical protein
MGPGGRRDYGSAAVRPGLRKGEASPRARVTQIMNVLLLAVYCGDEPMSATPGTRTCPFQPRRRRRASRPHLEPGGALTLLSRLSRETESREVVLGWRQFMMDSLSAAHSL